MYKLTDAEELELKKRAVQLRKNVLAIIKAGDAGHIGGALSATELMTALYYKVLKNIDPKNPKREDRDRFLMSAGHKCLIVYAVLGELGFFSKDLFDTYFKLNSKLPGHPDMHKLPGIESNTGSLGHGLPIAVGMALGLRIDKSSAKVYVIMGDGELGEGTNWEAAAAASHHKADNLVVMVDRNKFQLGGLTNDLMNFEPLEDKWKAFGWSTRSIDGHNLKEIVDTLTDAPFEKGKPSLIICNTIKAKGISFLQDTAASHYWKVSPEQVVQAEKELDAIAKELGA
ncbi:MAG: transketolase [Spirochaetia bacterium]|jgi:transketolase|nr:transketolase [Spirochaetia bacterium]